MTDIEGWGGPERMGLQREAGDSAVLVRSGIAGIVAGAGLWGLGVLGGSADLSFLAPLASTGARLGALICGTSGAAALLVAGARSRA